MGRGSNMLYQANNLPRPAAQNKILYPDTILKHKLTDLPDVESAYDKPWRAYHKFISCSHANLLKGVLNDQAWIAQSKSRIKMNWRLNNYMPPEEEQKIRAELQQKPDNQLIEVKFFINEEDCRVVDMFLNPESDNYQTANLSEHFNNSNCASLSNYQAIYIAEEAVDNKFGTWHYHSVKDCLYYFSNRNRLVARVANVFNKI